MHITQKLKEQTFLWSTILQKHESHVLSALLVSVIIIVCVFAVMIAIMTNSNQSTNEYLINNSRVQIISKNCAYVECGSDNVTNFLKRYSHQIESMESYDKGSCGTTAYFIILDDEVNLCDDFLKERKE